MGLLDKVKEVFKTAVESIIGNNVEKKVEETEEEKAKAEEEKRRKAEERKKKAEEKRKQEEEKNRYNLEGKSLEWFSSEDGIKVFNEYTTAQNYLLEETIKKEKEEKYDNYDLDIVVSVIHKDAKIPYVFFKKFVSNIEAQALDYVGPIDMLIHVLSIQAKPFYIDDDGEPQASERLLNAEEIVSIDKNPVLNYVANFNCFKFEDDNQGSWQEKWDLWSSMLIWLGLYCGQDKDFIAKNPWIFSNEIYFNDLGTVRKEKGFYKKCIEFASDKEYFEDKLNKCE